MVYQDQKDDEVFKSTGPTKKKKTIEGYAITLDRNTVPYGLGTTQELTSMSFKDGYDEEVFVDDEDSFQTGLVPPPEKEETLFTTPKKTATKTDFIDNFAKINVKKDSSSIFSPVQQLRPRATARQGTKFNPHIIHVNANFPESHREFDIEKIDRFEKAGWVVQGYHIRKDVGASDKGQW